MKNRLVTLAGALALIAVLGKYYAAPAIAQVVRAAVVKNIDEKGRIPYRESSSCTQTIQGNGCQAQFPTSFGNKRLVIEYVNALFFLSPDTGNAMPQLLVDSLNFSLPAFHGPSSFYGVSAPVLVYVDAGQNLRVNFQGNATQVHLTGYLVDLTQ